MGFQPSTVVAVLSLGFMFFTCERRLEEDIAG